MAKKQNSTLGCLALVLVFFAAIPSIFGGDDGDDKTVDEVQSLVSQPTSNDKHVVEDKESNAPPSGESLKYQPQQTVYVTASTLNGRSAPRVTSQVITKVSFRSSVRVVDRSGEWLKIASDAGDFWISSRYVSRSRPAPKPTARPRQYYRGNCPCRGSRVCIGPRGGRYCITSGGNKRYGV